VIEEAKKESNKNNDMPRMSEEEEIIKSAELIAKLHYENQASQTKDKQAYMMLYEMGFVDFDTNDRMMKKHKDVNIVAN